jgi:Domain of unknown function (DUF4400)
MIKVENNFARHSLFWFWTLPIVALLVMPVFFSPAAFMITQEETTTFANVMSIDTNAATLRANAIFSSMFIESGVYAAVNKFFHAPMGIFHMNGQVQAQRVNSTYASALWLMFYRGIWRLTALWPAVLSVIVAIGIPALIDGWATRAKKNYTFESHNPVYFWSASHSFIMVLGLGFFLPLTPVALSPVTFLFYSFMLCITAWVTAANFQTGT